MLFMHCGYTIEKVCILKFLRIGIIHIIVSLQLLAFINSCFSHKQMEWDTL